MPNDTINRMDKRDALDKCLYYHAEREFRGVVNAPTGISIVTMSVAQLKRRPAAPLVYECELCGVIVHDEHRKCPSCHKGELRLWRASE